MQELPLAFQVKQRVQIVKAADRTHKPPPPPPSPPVPPVPAAAAMPTASGKAAADAAEVVPTQLTAQLTAEVVPTPLQSAPSAAPKALAGASAAQRALTACGFSRADVDAALMLARGDELGARVLLLSLLARQARRTLAPSLVPVGGGASVVVGGGADEDEGDEDEDEHEDVHDVASAMGEVGEEELRAVAEEEKEVLRAIYGEAFREEEAPVADGTLVRMMHVHLESLPIAGTLTLHITDGAAWPDSHSAAEGGASCPQDGTATSATRGAHYPQRAALPLFVPSQRGALPPQACLAITYALSRKARKLAWTAAPAMYELATWLEEAALAEVAVAARAGHVAPPPALLASSALEAAPAAGDGGEATGKAEAAVEDVSDRVSEGGVSVSDLSEATTALAAVGRGAGTQGGRSGSKEGRAEGASGERRARFGREPQPIDPTSDACKRANASLLSEQQRLDSSPDEARRRLPAYGARAELLEALRKSRVVVVSGETGCGKSTQVPQYLLEDMCAAGRGGECSIVVTQPRRIAAIALAERVASERGGGKAGGVVGYAVRLESKVTRDVTRLLFCTTGVLLQRLRTDPTLRELSHVVIDEVHERSLDSDFLLIVLRDALAANPNLRVVLMSATLNAAGFAAYFGGAAMLHIPGRTFPIDDYFLEDAIEATGYVARGKLLLRGEEAEEELAPLAEQLSTAAAAADAATVEAAADASVADVASGGAYSDRTKKALQTLPAGQVSSALLMTADDR
jgi:hypothetical protein